MIWLLPFIMAALSRYIGTSHKGVGDLTIKALYAVPFGVFFGIWCLPSFLVAWEMRVTGSGGGQSLKEPNKPNDEAEWIERFTEWAKPHLSTYWYKTLILWALSALAFLPGAITAYSYYSPMAGLIWGLGGQLSKPLAYQIGWAIYPITQRYLPAGLKNPTEIGEFLTGLFDGLVIAASVYAR